jgi:hypothetical protein
MKKLLVLLLVLYATSAAAVTYEWTDDRGTINFTEDLGKVPKKYRKKAKVLGAEENGTPQVIEEPVKGSATGSGSAAGTKDAAQKDKKAAPGKDDAALRSEYGAAKSQLQAIDKNIADLRGRLQDTSKMSRSEYLSLQNTLKQEEFRAQEQRKKVDQLRQNAERAGINLDGK